MPGDTRKWRPSGSFHPVNFLATLAFFTFYLIDLGIYVAFIGTPNPSALQAVLTSPFSPHENYTSAYPSPTIGYIFNFWVVLLMVLMTDIYLRVVRPSRLRWNPSTLAFGLSIAASYTQSFLLWRLIETPSAGTSIIGSCMAITLFSFAGRDLLVEGRRRFHDPRNQPVPLVPIVFLVVFGAIYVAEYLNSSSIVAHLLGDALFLPLFALLLTAESAPAKIEGGRERYVFVSLVCLTVVLIAFPTFAPAAF